MTRIFHNIFPRPLSLLAAILFSMLAAIVAPAYAAENDDNKAVAEMQEKLKALRTQIASADKPLEQERLQRESLKIIEDTLPKLSPQGRALLQIGLKIMQPLQATSGRYLQMLNESMDSALGGFAEIKNRKTIQERLDKIALLTAANQEILNLINRLEPDMLALAAESGVPEAARAGFVEGYMKASGQKIGAMKAIRTLEDQLYANFALALRYLDAQWGQWSANNAAEIIWKDTSLEEKFLKIVEDIQIIAERQAQAEAALN